MIISKYYNKKNKTVSLNDFYLSHGLTLKIYYGRVSTDILDCQSSKEENKYQI